MKVGPKGVLLVLVAVILSAVVAEIVFRWYLRAKSHAAYSDRVETISRLNIVWEAIDVYYEEKGSWPDNLDALATIEKCRMVLSRLPAKCMILDSNSVAIRDGYGNNIIYSPTGGFGGRALLYSKGPDGRNHTLAEKKDNIYQHER